MMDPCDYRVTIKRRTRYYVTRTRAIAGAARALTARPRPQRHEDVTIYQRLATDGLITWTPAVTLTLDRLAGLVTAMYPDGEVYHGKVQQVTRRRSNGVAAMRRITQA